MFYIRAIFLLQSNSFTTAEIFNEATYSIVSEDWIGGFIQMIAHWDSGSAEIQSIIPQVNVDEMDSESNEEEIEE